MNIFNIGIRNAVILGLYEIIIGILCGILGLILFFIEWPEKVPNSIWTAFSTLNLLRIISYICWLYGIYREKSRLLLPSIVFTAVNILVITPFFQTIAKIIFIGVVMHEDGIIASHDHGKHFIFCILHMSLLVLNMIEFGAQLYLYKSVEKPREEETV